MSFAGKVWRLLVGIKDGLVLLFMLLFFWALFALLTARPSPAQVREGALLLELDGVIVEERANIDPLKALLSNEAPTREFQARDLVHALEEAAGDERITAVVLDLNRFAGGGHVHLQEVGEALDLVRAAEKPVLTYATAYTDDSILLAAHATEVWLNPLGGAVVAGPGGERLYFAGLLDQLDVNARIYKVGEYKSAVEPFSRSAMSQEARENAEAIVGVLWDEWQANVKKARPGADIARITTDPAGWIESFEGNLSRAALDAGLVDKLGSRAEFDARIVELVGEDEWSDDLNAYPATKLGAWLRGNPLPDEGKAIGVVTIAGEIVDADAGPGTASGIRIPKLLDEALDEDLAALVVRVDSPGGSALASEEIRNAILRHKDKGIPVAVSMANVAASGGYWVSTPGDRIFAEPETITGSIGIFAFIPTFEQTAAEYGVTSDGVRTTPLSGQPDFIAGFTPEVDSIIQSAIENGYREFLTRVAQSRGKTMEQADTVGRGRVWDGGTARQLGLVDQYGGMEEALAWAAEKAGLESGDWHVKYLGAERDTYNTLLRQWLIGDSERAAPGDVVAVLSDRERSLGPRIAADLDRLTGLRGMQVYCLECPDVGAAARAPQSLDGWLARLAQLVLR